MMGCGEFPKRKILNSIMLASLFWAGQETAKVDHYYFPNEGERFEQFDNVLLNQVAWRVARCKHGDPVKQEKLIKTLKWEFYWMVDEADE